MIEGMEKPAGRIAYRVEGKFWVVYWALPDSMEGAFELGRIAMAFVQDDGRKQAFMDIFREGVADFFAGRETPVERWHTQPAPESERSGSA